MKIVAIRELVSRGLLGLLMILLGYGSIINEGYGREWSGWFAILITNIFGRVLCTKFFLSMVRGSRER